MRRRKTAGATVGEGRATTWPTRVADRWELTSGTTTTTTGRDDDDVVWMTGGPWFVQVCVDTRKKEVWNGERRRGGGGRRQ